MLSIMGTALHGASAPQYSITCNINYCDDLKVVVNREALNQPLFSPSLSKRPETTEIRLKAPQQRRSIMKKKESKPMPMDVKP